MEEMLIKFEQFWSENFAERYEDAEPYKTIAETAFIAGANVFGECILAKIEKSLESDTKSIDNTK